MVRDVVEKVLLVSLSTALLPIIIPVETALLLYQEWTIREREQESSTRGLSGRSRSTARRAPPQTAPRSAPGIPSRAGTTGHVWGQIPCPWRQLLWSVQVRARSTPRAR